MYLVQKEGMVKGNQTYNFKVFGELNVVHINWRFMSIGAFALLPSIAGGLLCHVSTREE